VRSLERPGLRCWVNSLGLFTALPVIIKVKTWPVGQKRDFSWSCLTICLFFSKKLNGRALSLGTSPSSGSSTLCYFSSSVNSLASLIQKLNGM
jgi:hypothetical protein